MSQVDVQEELHVLNECQYSFPAETLSDLCRVRSLFSDLYLYVDFYCFPDQKKKKLLYLAGTIPVQFEGGDYNIPLCIWLHETHPVNRPRCYVCPTVSMVINPACPCVDANGNISLDGLRNWTSGVSNLSWLVSEMRWAFQKDTPLYASPLVQARYPTSCVLASKRAGESAESQQPPNIFTSSPSSSLQTLSLTTAVSRPKGNQWEQSRGQRSYAEDLLGIDFSAASVPELSTSSAAPPVDVLSRMVAHLHVDSEGSGHDPLQEPGPQKYHREPTEWTRITACLPPDKVTMFLSLLSFEGKNFSTDDVLQAVQLNKDVSSALKFLTHTCPICQDQVSFAKIVTMTHCSCFLCESCFKAFFSSAIMERSIEQLACPQCGQPEVSGPGGMEESMDYFNLLDTQIRHYLPPHIHELFQRKLRDRALQEMPNFRWCAHCSFGMLHEADQLRMDCPSCKKSTCSHCRSPWCPQHQGLSCQQFKVWQQQHNQPTQNHLLTYISIECPNCHYVFELSKGGCLHFTCTQCLHQFCGGCSQSFSLGSVCSFSNDCRAKGLHAHHPRDCLYHLRDWNIPRLHLLLQHYRVNPFCLEAAGHSSAESTPTGRCLLLELRDDGSKKEEPCGRPALPEYRGYCQLHYKEYLVELINRCRADPAVLFTSAEMVAELRRWQLPVPARKPEEPEPLYMHRLRLFLTDSAPLRKQSHSPLKLKDDPCLLTSSVAAGAPSPHLLSSD
ncbi:E3 ubiquitin-protein ligase RNF31 isoform X2 [Thalassophryne amazonica]|uniref:E3 ubiquitin-protein ligase RNF31 isoform X2 n=1 Tax=Thalassophryne amazonica TaxID=390379 RepID=UPI001471D329|nr:E3 ubiquitin-protein ligase RNF31 isoform X2 [Thalassophryne amazonica]